VRRDLVVAALAVLALLAVSLLGNREQPPPASTRASGDFSFGGYHGWYDMLAREGVRVERFRRHHDGLGESGIDTLIVAFPAAPVAHLWSAAERDALRAWVRRGGRLVDIGLTPAADKNDGKDERVFLDRTRGDRGPLHGAWSALVANVPGRGNDRLAPARRARVETLLADKAGALVVRYRYGRGEVVGVATAALFENRAIGGGDVARLAFLVAQPGRSGGTVAFDEAVRGDVIEKPWYRALTAPELLALALAALAGLLWLAYGIVPLGPPVRLRAPREPASDEFVDAVAALYERARARDHARDALVRDARRSLEFAPRTAGNAELAQRIDAAKNEPVSNDAALVAVARLARTARENETTMVMGRAPSNRARHRMSLRGRTGGPT
jgi:uncharacterized protein DUF4350